MAANDKQVAGDHYRTKGDKIQHWDLTVMFGWDPFQYQITKYVMRWKDKHATHAERVQDLKKALHFLEKYIEEAAAYDPRMGTAGEQPKEPVEQSSPLPLSTKQLASREAETALWKGDFTIEGYFGDNTQHYKCVHCHALIRADSIGAAHWQHPACAAAHSQVAHP